MHLSAPLPHRLSPRFRRLKRNRLKAPSRGSQHSPQKFVTIALRRHRGPPFPLSAMSCFFFFSTFFFFFELEVSSPRASISRATHSPPIFVETTEYWLHRPRHSSPSRFQHPFFSELTCSPPATSVPPKSTISKPRQRVRRVRKRFFFIKLSQ